MKNTTLEVGKNFRFHFVHLSFPFFLAVFTFPYQHQHETLFIDCRCFLRTVVFSSPTRHDVAEEKKKSPHLALLVCGARGCVFCCRICRREKIFEFHSLGWASTPFLNVPDYSPPFFLFSVVILRPLHPAVAMWTFIPHRPAWAAESERESFALTRGEFSTSFPCDALFLRVHKIIHVAAGSGFVRMLGLNVVTAEREKEREFLRA